VQERARVQAETAARLEQERLARIEQERIAAEKARQVEEINQFNGYIDKLTYSHETMKSGVRMAQNISSAAERVWSNSVFKRYDEATNLYTRSGITYVDFNTAIANYYEDSTTKALVKALNAADEIVSSSVRELQGPPDGCLEAYNIITTLYKSYSTLIDFAKWPSGSLQTFSNTRTATATEFNSVSNQLQMIIPQKRNLPD
jgi:hypothetical protein